ncbi:MAG: hypothetical protein CL763_10205 [Chloroflexi bacterium]|nr:hypothetical protein [Chloroflexota bacterium]|tara:strand:+ start:10592 stop:12043 length:1452 start_codon:yes stop_codon:yes gene_type:complete
MKPEYKRHGRDEKLLEKLLPSYDNSVVQTMLLEAGVQIDQIGRFMMGTEPKSFYIKDMHGQESFWEMKFYLPVIQYVPDFFRFLTHNSWFNKYGHLENIPSYITNINHITLLENYNHNNPEFGNNTEGIIKKYVSEKGAKMRMSSLNLLLRYNTQPKYLSEAQNVVKMSFELCYWNPPDPKNVLGACIDNLIYSTETKIKNILLTRKTLVKILEIKDRKEKRSIFYSQLFQSEPILVKQANVLVLCDDGDQIREKKFNVFLAEDVADSLNEGDLFNAFMVMSRKSNSRLTMPFVIGKIGKKIQPGDVKHVMAIVFWKMLQTLEDNSSPTLVGSISEAVTKITNIIQSNSEMFSSENFSADMLGWTKDLPKKIQKGVEEMFPMYQIIENKVYQLSPVMMTFLACYKPEILQNKEAIPLIMKLFDNAFVNQRDWDLTARRKLRTDQNYSDLQTSHSINNQLIEKSQRIVNGIVYSRILSQHQTHW